MYSGLEYRLEYLPASIDKLSLGTYIACINNLK